MGWRRWGRRIFLFFFAFLRFFLFFTRVSSLFSLSPRGQGQKTAIYSNTGEFHSDPVYTNSAQNFPKIKLEVTASTYVQMTPPQPQAFDDMCFAMPANVRSEVLGGILI